MDSCENSIDGKGISGKQNGIVLASKFESVLRRGLRRRQEEWCGGGGTSSSLVGRIGVRGSSKPWNVKSFGKVRDRPDCLCAIVAKVNGAQEIALNVVSRIPSDW